MHPIIIHQIATHRVDDLHRRADLRRRARLRHAHTAGRGSTDGQGASRRVRSSFGQAWALLTTFRRV